MQIQNHVLGRTYPKRLWSDDRAIETAMQAANDEKNGHSQTICYNDKEVHQ